MSSTTTPSPTLPASTPANLSPSTLAPSASRLHITTPPPSPSPFMKDFAANALPPPTAVAAETLFSASTSSRLWRRIANVRRAYILVVLVTAVMLFRSLVGPAAIVSANFLRNRFQHEIQHEESFVHGPMRTIRPADLHLQRRRIKVARQQSANLNASSTPTPTSSSATSTSLATAPPIPTGTPPLPTPFPQPFDDTLSGSAFVSGSCQKFFTAFTNDINFRSCRAFSFLYSSSETFLEMLEPTSTGFGNVTDPLQALTDVIWGMCNTTTDQASCASRMTDYETQLQKACGTELSQDQPIVVNALHGFRNFNLMRSAVCLANQRTSSYCFVDAVAAANHGAPSDIYFYQLPLGTPLPGTGTKDGIKLTTTCSTCTRSLMGVYLQYISKAEGGGGLDNGAALLIHGTYQDAYKFVNKQCGAGYATTINVSSSAATRVITQWGIAPLLLWALGILFLQREGW